MSPSEETFDFLPSARRAAGKTPVLLVASSNPHKISEFRLGLRIWLEKLAASGETPLLKSDVQPVPGIETLPACMEDGDTFSENAIKKAVHYSRFASGLVLADDSGLEVDALGGAPGVWSRRYSGAGANDSRNNAKLLEKMRDIPGDERGSQFVCVLVLARCGQPVAEFRGEVRGMVLNSPRGANGFGYDPLFLHPASQKTFAEMTATEKLEHSHRGQALRALFKWQSCHPEWLCGER
jgi:XTP/dITP diphosphohydrolase